MIVTENNYLFDCKLNIAFNTTDSLYLCTDINSSQQKNMEDLMWKNGANSIDVFQGYSQRTDTSVCQEYFSKPVDINIATSIYAQARQLHTFQNQGYFWNRLRFGNKCFILLEEI